MYCALSDITDTIPLDEVLQLTDDGNTGEIDTKKVEEAISKADSLIAAFIGEDTLDPIPKIIQHISIDLSIYHLYKRRFTSNMPDSLQKGYSHSIDLLKQIQSGKLSIGVAKDEQIVSRSYKITKKRDDRMFSKEILRSY